MHSKLAPVSVDVNANDALVDADGSAGAETIVVSGAVVSGGVVVPAPGPYCWSATRQSTPRPLAWRRSLLLASLKAGLQSDVSPAEGMPLPPQ